MLSNIFINSLDMVNIVYLWTILNKKNNNVYKFLGSTPECVLDSFKLSRSGYYILIKFFFCSSLYSL